MLVGTGRGVQAGVLVRNAAALERAEKIQIIVIDKTGTLTEGKPVVTDVLPIGAISANDLLQIVASLEQGSEHPLARAILDSAHQAQFSLLPIQDFCAVVGSGVKARIHDLGYKLLTP